MAGTRIALFLAMVLTSSPVTAGWKLMPAGKPVKVGAMTVTPLTDWNRASARPGKLGVAWTQDGFGLNGLELFAGIPTGQPLYRERNAKRSPMPKYDNMMLPPDLVDFFERSFRVQYQITDFAVDEVKPATFGGHRGIAVQYRYTQANDEMKRRGVARLVVVGPQLFVANFYAPELHYFSAGRPEAETIMDSARF